MQREYGSHKAPDRSATLRVELLNSQIHSACAFVKALAFERASKRKQKGGLKGKTGVSSVCLMSD